MLWISPLCGDHVDKLMDGGWTASCPLPIHELDHINQHSAKSKCGGRFLNNQFEIKPLTFT